MTHREQTRLATIKSLASDYCQAWRGSSLDRELVAIEIDQLGIEEHIVFVSMLPAPMQSWYLHGAPDLADRLGSGPQTLVDDGEVPLPAQSVDIPAQWVQILHVLALVGFVVWVVGKL